MAVQDLDMKKKIFKFCGESVVVMLYQHWKGLRDGGGVSSAVRKGWQRGTVDGDLGLVSVVVVIV